MIFMLTKGLRKQRIKIDQLKQYLNYEKMG